MAITLSGGNPLFALDARILRDTGAALQFVPSPLRLQVTKSSGIVVV